MTAYRENHFFLNSTPSGSATFIAVTLAPVPTVNVTAVSPKKSSRTVNVSSR